MCVYAHIRLQYDLTDNNTELCSVFKLACEQAAMVRYIVSHSKLESTLDSDNNTELCSVFKLYVAWGYMIIPTVSIRIILRIIW